MITDEAKTVEELREQCSVSCSVARKVQGLLLEAQAQISALEKECDRYGLHVSRQDEEITRLRRDCHLLEVWRRRAKRNIHLRAPS